MYLLRRCVEQDRNATLLIVLYYVDAHKVLRYVRSVDVAGVGNSKFPNSVKGTGCDVNVVNVYGQLPGA